MTTRKYSSRSQQTTLTGALTSSGTSATVVSGSGLLGGVTISAGELFTVVIDPDTALEEIVDVSAVSTNTLTIVRGVDGSTGQAHSAGAVVRHMAIGRDYREANQHIENTTTAHGLTIANVLETTDTNMITTAMLQSNAVTTAKITDANITAAKLASDSVTTVKILDANVTTAKIADSNVTTAKIADSAVTSAKIADGTIVAGDIADGAITSAKILDGTIATSDIADSAITTAKVADSAITSAKIADATIATGDLADGAVTSAKIADGTIVAGDLADGSVTSAKILDGTIVNADINAAAAIDKTKISGTAVTVADTGTVTSTMILDGTIVDGDVSATAAIAKTKLNLGGTITSADLVDGTIVNADINASAGIALSKLAVDPLARANHTGTQLAATVSDFDTQVRTSKVTDLAAPTTSFSMNSQKITNLADPTSNQDAVTLKYLTDQKGATNGIASLDGSGKIPTGQLPAIAISDTFVVSSQSAMLALTAEVGDIAVRTDVNKSFILRVAGASTLANWQELLTPTDSVLSVDGNTGAIVLSGTYLAKAGGTMTGNLVLNADPSVNLGAATKQYVDAVAGSATAAAASAAAAATTYDNFDDRYLGAKTSAPTVDNDGNTLLVGAIYWNSVANAMYAWTGSAWGSISSTADIFRYRYTASGGETTESGPDDNGVTLTYIPGKEQVYLNGVLLARTSDYNATNGTSITGLAALAAGDILEVITFTAFELANVLSPTLFDAKGDLLAGTGADTVGKLTVGSNGQYLQADSSTSTGLKWSTVTGYSAPTLGSTSIASGATVTNVDGLTINSTTIPSSVTLVSTAATQTLTNKSLTAPTLTGTVTASGDINLSGAGAVGSVNDEFALILMGAL